MKGIPTHGPPQLAHKPSPIRRRPAGTGDLIRRHMARACSVIAAIALTACGTLVAGPNSLGATSGSAASTAVSLSAPTATNQITAGLPAQTIQGPQVILDNFTFSPAVLTVTVGTRVTWTNHDDIPHTVTAANGSFASPALDTDDQFSYQFSATGTYTYFCSIHPHMTGRIIVR